MKEFWNTVQFVFTAVGGWLGYFLGGCDGLIYALLAFVVIDYLTGVMCAVSDKKLSSAVGFRGIWQKGFDLSACRNCQHPGCAGNWYGQCVTDSGDLLLPFQ